MSRSLAAAAALLALSTLVPATVARGDTRSGTRVTIRGSGNTVVIERGERPVQRRSSEVTAVPVPAGPITEAIHRKSQGASDSSVISYLRAHEAELPPVVGSEDVKQLRKAGAGKTVMVYLTTVAAVDIGETGRGHETAVFAAPVSPYDQGTALYGLSDTYPLAGGYGAPYPARIVPRGFPRLRRMALPPGRLAFRPPIPSRAPFPRRPTTE